MCQYHVPTLLFAAWHWDCAGDTLTLFTLTQRTWCKKGRGQYGEQGCMVGEMFLVFPAYVLRLVRVFFSSSSQKESGDIWLGEEDLASGVICTTVVPCCKKEQILSRKDL